MNPRLKKYLFLGVLFFGLLAAFYVVSENVSATAYDWDGGDGANQLASDPDNWNPDGVPITGDVITVSGGNDEAITWDLGAGVCIASFNQQAGYSGTLTTTSIFNCSGPFTLAGGVFVQGAFAVNTGDVSISGAGTTLTGNVNAWWTPTNFNHAAGTITSSVLSLKFVVSGSYGSAATLGRLWVAGGTLIKTVGNSIASYLQIDTGCTLLLNTPAAGNEFRYYAGSTYINDGTIARLSTSTLIISFYSGDKSSAIGDIRCPILIELVGTAAASHVWTISADAIIQSTLTVDSLHASNTMTLNLAGHSLSATTITASTRGIISSSVAGAKLTATGAITVLATGQIDATNIAYLNCGGFDPSAGTWVPDNCQVNITSAYKVMKLGAAQSIYDLQLVNNINVTGAASVTHLIKYSGMAASQHWHWYWGTTLIINETSNASGVIDLPAQTLAVHNLYMMTSYPFVTSSPTLSVAEDSAYLYDAAADQAVTWSIVTKPAWASFAIAGGVLSGTPDNGDVAATSVSIKLTNANGTIEYHNFTLTVTNVAPVMSGTYPDTAQYGFVYMSTSSTDEDAWVTWTLSTSSNDLTLDSTGLVYGKIRDLVNFWFNITANDGHGGTDWTNVTVTVYIGVINPHAEINATESGRLRITFTYWLENDPPEYVLSVAWNFGDGQGSHDAYPTHTYGQQGTYLVTVAMWLINGDIAYTQKSIVVGDPLYDATPIEVVDWWASIYGMATAFILLGGFGTMVGYSAYQQKKRKHISPFVLLIIGMGAGAALYLALYGGFI